MGAAPVKVYSLPTAWGVPSLSPFCLKLLTWFRMVDIPYELHVLHGPPTKPRTRKAPYIERADGSIMPDSNFIIQALSEEWQVTLDDHLNDKQRAIAHLLQRTLEKSLYFVAVWHRWNQHWDEVRPGIFADLPPPARVIIAPFVRRYILKQPWAQGVTRNTTEQIYAAARGDIEAVSSIMGDKDFFFGKPSTIDATAYGLFANLLNPPVDSPLVDAVRAQTNIVAFCDRMADRYWSDWKQTAVAA